MKPRTSSPRSLTRSTLPGLNHRLPVTRLNSPLDRRLGRYPSTLLSGRPYRPPNHLREACKILRAYVRLAEQDRKRNPLRYDPLWAVRQLEEQKQKAEIQRALDRVYGPPSTPCTGVGTTLQSHSTIAPYE